MKTTLDLPDALLDEARRVARVEGITLRALVSDGLRNELDARARGATDAAAVSPVFSGRTGLQPGVDLGDWEVVRDITYGRWGG